MNKRTQQILEALVKEHVKTGQPVGSEALVSRYKLGVSSATVRNELAELESSGYIIQPHTSAGRIPTEAAYRHCLEGLREKKVTGVEADIFAKLLEDKGEAGIKQLAKALAQASGLAVFWAFHRHNLYYTGVANFLSQPEFRESSTIYDVSAIIDRVDEIIDSIYNDTPMEPTVLIGQDNPFSPICSTIITRYRLGDHTGLFGILGPLRMNYERNYSLVKHIKDHLA
ncbi:hypothetical protein HGA64_00215 [Candidatus Falkowbacteria bacterium]|nr:hypothetical protein [Candidatus Falkowbacteria bacterium]